jgi:hypothetical protein
VPPNVAKKLIRLSQEVILILPRVTVKEKKLAYFFLRPGDTDCDTFTLYPFDTPLARAGELTPKVVFIGAKIKPMPPRSFAYGKPFVCEREIIM